MSVLAGTQRVLIVTLLVAPDTVASAALFTALANDLGRAGLFVDILSSQAQPGGRHVAVEWHRRVTVARVWQPFKRTGLIGRLGSCAVFNIGSAIRMIGLRKPDVMLADGPVIWCLASVLIARFVWRVPCIYIVHDIQPDMALAVGALREGWVARLWRRLEGLCYRLTDIVSTVGEGAAKLLEARGVERHRIVVIPPCPDTRHLFPVPRETELRREWEMDGKYVAMYTGTIGLAQNVEELARAGGLLGSRPEIAILIVGDGPRRSEVDRLIRERSLANVHLRPLQPASRVNELLNTADVVVIPLQPGVGVAAVPSKLFATMASGRPVIASCSEDSELARVVRQCGAGIVAACDASSIAAAIAYLRDHSDEARSMADRGRQAALRDYSRERASDEYARAILRLARKSRGEGPAASAGAGV